MKNNVRWIFTVSLVYILFAVSSIHTINNIFFYMLSFFLIVYFLWKNFLKLSFSIFLIVVVLMPIWLLFNNIFYDRLLHYSLLSDVLSTLMLSVLFSCINSDSNRRIKIIYILIPVVVVCFYKYLAYNNIINLASIILMAICGLNVFTVKFQRSHNKIAKIMLIFAVLITTLFSLVDNLRMQSTGKIAILKSNWCDTSIIPNKASHEINYYYAYSDFVNVLKSYGDVKVINSHDISRGLDDYNVVILITPTEPIFGSQVKKLVHFVEQGGRLILITDHTNLFGHLDNVKGLLHAFSVRMNDDAIFNPCNYHEKALLNTNTLKLNEILTKTGNSFIPPVTSKIWAITHKIISEKADYTKDNFFGDLLFTSDDCVGNFIIGATVQKGLGKFVIWNDSTLFSNFAITQKNNIELIDYIVKNKVYDNDSRKTIYKFINVASDNIDTFLEAPPNQKPSSIHFSTLIANFSRYDLFPDYSEISSEETIFFTSYDYLVEHINEIKSKKIVVIDDIPCDNILKVKKYSFDTYEVTNSSQNFYYSKDGINITVAYNNKDIILAKNVLSDNELGTWWNITSISPYKKDMINKFFSWLKDDSKIQIYKYPDLHSKDGCYLVKANNNFETYWENISISYALDSDHNKVVYLGNRRWAFIVDSNTYFGNPELSDNYSNTLDIKWTAKLVDKKDKIKKKDHTHFLSILPSKFQVGIKLVAP